MTEEIVTTQAWMLEQLVDGPTPTDGDSLDIEGEITDSEGPDGVAGQRRGTDAAASDEVARAASAPSELDRDAVADGDQSDRDVNRGAKRTAMWLGCGAVAMAVLIVVAFVGFGGGPDPALPPQHHATVAAVAAAPSTNATVPQQDQAVPFAGSSDSCTPDGASGEPLAARSPVALTDTSSDSAWVCGRGPQESQLDGQVLHVRFLCDPSRPNSACSYMLNSLSVTPGWVAKTQGGKDEWLQHRVVTRLQFNFFNGNQLVDDPLPVDTHSIHGPVSVTLRRKILVSRADVIILHTDRPPATPPSSTSQPGPGPAADTGEHPPNGLIDSLLGASDSVPAWPAPADLESGATASDPVDATFAMSQLQFFGHSPN